MKKVKIINTASGETYTVSCELECKSALDKLIYRTVIKTGDTVYLPPIKAIILS